MLPEPAPPWEPLSPNGRVLSMTLGPAVHPSGSACPAPSHSITSLNFPATPQGGHYYPSWEETAA